MIYLLTFTIQNIWYASHLQEYTDFKCGHKITDYKFSRSLIVNPKVHTFRKAKIIIAMARINI